MKEDLKLKLKLLIPFILKGDKIEMIIPFGIAEEVLEEAGFSYDNDDWSQNGWQVDYWTKFTKDNISYKVSGSLYYGGFKMQKEIL